jgi:hypothetical protein
MAALRELLVSHIGKHDTFHSGYKIGIIIYSAFVGPCCARFVIGVLHARATHSSSAHCSFPHTVEASPVLQHQTINAHSTRSDPNQFILFPACRPQSSE